MRLVVTTTKVQHFTQTTIELLILGAQNIRVGLSSDKSIKEIEGIVGKGTYFVFKDSIQLAKLGPADILKATYTGGVVRVVVNGVEKGRGKSIRLIQDKQEDYLQVRLISPVAKQRSYEGDFDIEIRKEALNLINNLDMISISSDRFTHNFLPHFFNLQSL